MAKRKKKGDPKEIILNIYKKNNGKAINNKIIDFPYLNKLVDYLKFSDYIILYGILFIISLIISLKFGKSIFKKSAIKTFNEEV